MKVRSIMLGMDALIYRLFQAQAGTIKFNGPDKGTVEYSRPIGEDPYNRIYKTIDFRIEGTALVINGERQELE